VVELYVAAPDSRQLNKPAKELKAFAKTRSLKPGESEQVELKVKAADLASFDEASSSWKVDAGNYKFLVGASSRDIRATLSAKVKAGRPKPTTCLLQDQAQPAAPLICPHHPMRHPFHSRQGLPPYKKHTNIIQQ
jgi:beta-glucosidase